jgi:hypothetical protein
MGYVTQEQEMMLPRDNSMVSRAMMTNLHAQYVHLEIRLAVIEKHVQGLSTMQQLDRRIQELVDRRIQELVDRRTQELVDRRIQELGVQVEQIEYRLNDHQARLERIRRVWLMLRAPWRLMRQLTSATPFARRPTWLTNRKWEGMSHEATRELAMAAFAKRRRRE